MGLTRRGVCRKRCEQARNGRACSCPKEYCYYVEFRVWDDGESLRLAGPHDGGRLKRWKVGGNNKEEAKNHEAIIRGQLLNGEILSATSGRSVTLRDYAARWLDAAKTELAPKTYANYKHCLDAYVLPALGHHVLARLTWRDIRTFLADKRTNGYTRQRKDAKEATPKPYSANTVRLMRAALSTVLTDAAEDGYITANPILSQRQKKKRTDTPTPAVDALEWSQKEAFEAKLSEYAAMGKITPPYATVFHVMLKAGLRPGEALALKPGDIDLSGRKLRVERSLSYVDEATGKTFNGKPQKERRYFVKATKTGKRRWVDLSPALCARLETYLTWLKAEAVGRGVSAEWLFPSENWTWIDERNVARALDRVLADAGLPHFTPYDLRHTYASLLLSSNRPLPYVSQQLGHTKPMITLRYYTRWIPTGQDNLTDVLDGSPNTLITPAQAARGADSVRA